jgi:SAM-dependent methyltransferase
MYEKVTVPEGVSGDYRIERFEVPEKYIGKWRDEMMGREIPAGTYTRLLGNGTVMMSDTPSEMRDHRLFIVWAEGKILIAGLGIGFVLNEVAKNEKVSSVTVIEKSQEVIDLVWEHYKRQYGDKINLIHGDVFDSKQLKGMKFDMGWFDIWDNICGDNVEDFKKLRKAYSRMIVKDRRFWCEPECIRANRGRR